MRRECEVLLVEDSDQRRRDYKVILDFLNETSYVTSSQEWLDVAKNQIESSDAIVAVLLGDCHGRQASKVIQEIHDWEPGIPFVYIGSSPLENQIQPEQRRLILSMLEEPLTYNQLLDHLHRAQIYREQFAHHHRRSSPMEVPLFRNLVGNSPKIQYVREMMNQVADKEVTVMITGESGTGKEVVARNLHLHSKRRNKPFVPVNCGAIPGDLLESELFGHEKGAFTGAISSKPGRFELAEGGTLFLDEIGDMPLNMQVKLLRVLQEHTYERVGGTKTLKTDVRIIAATHKNLEDMIREGGFREDLYYRLNVFPIEMSPLRDRVEDLPLLITELVNRLESDERGSVRFSSDAMRSLCKHDWPGNVRELANLVERLSILYPSAVIGLSELPEKFRHLEKMEQVESLLEPFTQEDTDSSSSPLISLNESPILPSEGVDLKEYLTRLERSLIQQALDDSQGVVARAAERLRIRRTTLVEKMRKYGLQRRERETFVT